MLTFLDSYSSRSFVAAPEEIREEDKNGVIVTETAGWMEWLNEHAAHVFLPRFHGAPLLPYHHYCNPFNTISIVTWKLNRIIEAQAFSDKPGDESLEY